MQSVSKHSRIKLAASVISDLDEIAALTQQKYGNVEHKRSVAVNELIKAYVEDHPDQFKEKQGGQLQYVGPRSKE